LTRVCISWRISQYLFLFAAALVGIFYIVGAIHFWSFLTQISFFSAQNKFFLLAAIILSDAISVGILLAISGELTLGRTLRITPGHRGNVFLKWSGRSRSESFLDIPDKQPGFMCGKRFDPYFTLRRCGVA